MAVYVLQHAPFEGLGSMADALARAGAPVQTVRLYDGDPLPPLDTAEMVIALGGPMSANDEREFPWLAAEKAFLRAACNGGVPVLGVCLGAQLIASALGARVYPIRCKEIGWFPVEAAAGIYRLPTRFMAFHWHGETFDLPQNAVRLARNGACENQAFQVGTNVIGLQFHLETTPQSADSILNHCRHELVTADTVQTEEAIRSAAPSLYSEANVLMEEVLDFLMR